MHERVKNIFNLFPFLDPEDKKVVQALEEELKNIVKLEVTFLQKGWTFQKEKRDYKGDYKYIENSLSRGVLDLSLLTWYL